MPPRADVTYDFANNPSVSGDTPPVPVSLPHPALLSLSVSLISFSPLLLACLRPYAQSSPVDRAARTADWYVAGAAERQAAAILGDKPDGSFLIAQKSRIAFVLYLRYVL